MIPKWWENEEPVTASTHKNTLRFYPKAGRLQVARPDWLNLDTNERHPGKSVALDLSAMRGTEAVTLLETVLAWIKEGGHEQQA